MTTDPDNSAGLIGIAGLKLIDDYQKALRAVQSFTFPRLIVEEVENEDADCGGPQSCEDEDCEEEHLIKRLICPWCEGVAHGDDDVYWIEIADRWCHNYAVEQEQFTSSTSGGGVMKFSSDSDADDDMLYMVHESCSRPVSLPEGWDTDWN